MRLYNDENNTPYMGIVKVTTVTVSLVRRNSSSTNNYIIMKNNTTNNYKKVF